MAKYQFVKQPDVDNYDIRDKGISFTINNTETIYSTLQVITARGIIRCIKEDGSRTDIYKNGTWYLQDGSITDVPTIIDIDVETLLAVTKEWFLANTESITPSLTFKHFYDAGTIGSGAVKFRHYSQQEPSSGAVVIKAGTYKWVDTPNIQGIIDIIGEDGGIDGQFKSSDINFDNISFSATRNWITYYPPENFASLIENEEVDVCGYIYEQWVVAKLSGGITEVPSLQTFIVLEDIDLISLEGDTELEQAVLTWFTANTTKLS